MNNTHLQRHLTDVELVDSKGYLLWVSVWSHTSEVFQVNRNISMYNVQVNAQYQRGHVSYYSGWLFSPSVSASHPQQPREVFVLHWVQSSSDVIALRVSIWSSILGHFIYTESILLPCPRLLGGKQHNIFHTRSLSAGVANEVLAKGGFFCLLAFLQDLKSLHWLCLR